MAALNDDSNSTEYIQEPGATAVNHKKDDSDILITSDIPLAAKAIEKKAIVIRPDGSKLTQQNIGNILATRDLMSDIRAADPFHQSKSKPFSKADKGAFRQILASLLTQKKS